MSRIFISYRRSDASPAAGRIYDYLERHFGGDSLFMDVDALQPGEDFRMRIREAVGQCQVLLAVISRGWLQAKDEAGCRRLDNPADWVRLEVEAALERQVTVIPVLSERGLMPRVSELPETLQPLAYRQAALVRHGRDFKVDMARLTAVIQQRLESKAQRQLATAELEVAKVVDVKDVVFERFETAKEARKSFAETLGNGVTLALVRIPEGTFLMGSPPDEPERRNDEGPQHEVSVAASFIGKYPVTQAQWRVVAALPKVKRNLEPSPSRFSGYNLPVESVSWEDAAEFCDRLSAKTNRSYRLPNEAEWEYACRAGTTTPFYFGETLTSELANYNANYTYNNGEKGEYRVRTTKVGSFPENAFGLHDMHGNVSEWCQDNWHSNYEGAPADGSVWLNNNNKNRVLRGGSLITNPGFCRSAQRIVSLLDRAFPDVGFRVSYSAPRTLT